MDDRGHVVAQRHHAELEAQLHAALGRLLDHVAHQEGQQTLGLIVLDHGDRRRGIVGLAQHHGHAGDVAGDQRNAQRADDRIGHEADAAVVFIGVCAFHIFQTLEDLRAHGGGQTGVQRVAQLGLVGDQALEHADAGGQIAQLGHLHARGRVDRREEVRRIREGGLRVRAVLFNGRVDGIFRQSRHCVGACENQIG